MNDLLELNGVLQEADFGKRVVVNLAKNKCVESKKLEQLKSDLIRLSEFWKNEHILPRALISVYYNRTIP